MRFAVVLLLGACFDPHAQTGVPCGATNRACPSGQRCSAEGTCEVDPTDAIDASSIDTQVVPGDVMRPDPGWYAVTPLPAARSLGCTVTANGLLFSIGGSLSQVKQAEVWVTTIADNGMLGAWTETTRLPDASRWHACAVDEATSSVYVAGGDLGVNASAVVLRAPITMTGLGAWQPMPALPSPRRGHSAVVVGGRLYVLGGEQNNGFAVRDTVFVSAIANDGTLGAWSTTTALPVPDYMFGTAVANGTVFVTGGYVDHVKTHRAPIATTVGTFADATPLPGPRERHASVALDNFVYIMGGEPTYATPNLRTAFRAVVANGALGAWTALPDLPDAIAYSSATVDRRGYIYLVGGSNDTGQVAAVELLVPP